MAKIIVEGSRQPRKDRSWTNYEIVTGQNLRPAFGQLSINQPIELVDQEGNIIKRSNADESSQKKSDSNFNGCGQDITEEYLKSD